MHILIAMNKALRIITGSVSSTSTPTEWLSVLANIEPPEVRRMKAFLRQWNKLMSLDELPIQNDLRNVPRLRLSSRKPTWLIHEQIDYTYCPTDHWKAIWEQGNVRYHDLVDDPTTRQVGFEIPRKAWVTLNRLRTGHSLLASLGSEIILRNRIEHVPPTQIHVVMDCSVWKKEYQPGTKVVVVMYQRQKFKFK
ncbi:hypothetical protein Bhyg_14481 [Pseudolycoriella hygida]|uniref:Uncharacterized protein n=1 Tax=Pseudolycoriella hygida TaxID=35572 RepID=A0A9Q0MRM8_9DIPT|nr:hypothetical protein Bhyg_14481 [Pseudolycoriella hygida]